MEPVERAQLEANIVADGCRDPLVVWPCPTFEIRLDGGATQTLRYEEGRYQHAIDEHIGPTTAWDLDDNADDDRIDEYGDTITLDQWPHLLVDGHNRYEICTRLGISFDTVAMDFADRDAAMDWIDANQMGKRNMSPEAFTRALGRRYNRAKKQGQRSDLTSSQNDPKLQTADRFATEYGVSPATVKRAGAYDSAAAVIEAAGGSVAGENFRDVVEAAKVVAQIPDAATDLELAAEFAEIPKEAQQEAIAAIAEASEPAKEVMREAVKNHRAIGTGENEWYTPAEYVELAREVMGGIDLDPASCAQANEVVGAATFYTKEDDGLSKDWAGRLWLNPPYSRDLMPAFVEKLRESFIDGDVQQAILVSHNNTDTGWFHALAGVASAICFPKKRIRFYRDAEVAAPTNGQAFFYLGDDPQTFISTFSGVGFVVRPA